MATTNPTDVSQQDRLTQEDSSDLDTSTRAVSVAPSDVMYAQPPGGLRQRNHGGPTDAEVTRSAVPEAREHNDNEVASLRPPWLSRSPDRRTDEAQPVEFARDDSLLSFTLENESVAFSASVEEVRDRVLQELASAAPDEAETYFDAGDSTPLFNGSDSPQNVDTNISRSFGGRDADSTSNNVTNSSATSRRASFNGNRGNATSSFIRDGRGGGRRPPRMVLERSPSGGLARIRIQVGPHRHHGAPPSGTNNRSPGARPATTLPPLKPQPLADSKQDFRRRPDIEEKRMERFHCSICFNILNDPVGCGQCPNRFCMECWMKAIRHSRRPSSNIGSTTAAQCPTCRKNVPSAVRDPWLLREIESADSVFCRFVGCGQFLHLQSIASHEETCGAVQVACRFANFGCDWTGSRSQVEQHESSDCTLSKVASFVEQHRRLQQQVNELGNLQQQVRGVAQMVHVVMQQQAWRSPCNPFDLVAFVSTVLCTTPCFLATKNTWRKFAICTEGRATTFNILCLMPTFLITLKLVVSGYQGVVSFFDNSSTKATASASSAELAYGDLVSLLTGGLNCVLLAVCLLSDSTSAHRFKKDFKMIGLKTKGPYTFLGCCWALASLHTVSIVSCSSFLRGILLSIWVSISSFVFPVIVAALMAAAAPATRNRSQLLCIGRVFLPLVFGIRSGLCIHCIGFLHYSRACVFYLSIQRDLGRMSKKLLVYREAPQANDDKPRQLLFPACLFLLVSLFGKWYHEEHFFEALLGPLVSLAVIVSTNAMSHFMIWLGTAIGRRIHQQAVQELHPNGAPVRKQFSALGVGVVGIFLCINALILAT